MLEDLVWYASYGSNLSKKDFIVIFKVENQRAQILVKLDAMTEHCH